MSPFIVAELSANHLGSLERALAIANAAAIAGADALKLQTWTPDSMAMGGAWKGKPLVDLYREAYLPWDWHADLFLRCKELGIECFSTPFDREAADFLESLGCPRFKIASFEIVDLPLIRYVAGKGKPMIISTGMATIEEIAEAVDAAACKDLTLLKCTSAYPADASEANLAAGQALAGFTFGRIAHGTAWGLSDHTEGIGVAVAAVARGAVMIEKHLTLSRSDGGPDAAHSLEPNEFAHLVTECRRAAEALGEVTYGPTAAEAQSLTLRRSLWIVRDMEAGDILTPDNLRTARPAEGLAPKHLPELLGRRVGRSLKAGTPMGWECLA